MDTRGIRRNYSSPSYIGNFHMGVKNPVIWQERRGSNPQPPVLETGALPIELHSYITLRQESPDDVPSIQNGKLNKPTGRPIYASLCDHATQ